MKLKYQACVRAKDMPSYLYYSIGYFYNKKDALRFIEKNKKKAEKLQSKFYDSSYVETSIIHMYRWKGWSWCFYKGDDGDICIHAKG